MSSHRIDRINTDAMREIAEIIRTLKDPRIPEMTSVVSVEVTNDLRYAKVFVSIYGNDEEKKNALKGLNSSAGFVRKELSGRLNLRYTPEITFVADNSIAYGAHISQILNKLNREDEQGDK